ncbi:hypothetical protein JZ751_019400 [Albula glossodonta]|uniref:Pleckstrin homology domain-containing family F member 1 n=1 Tax=Albula glossodonta TaxID=121402 RepID=A0A8T2NUU8_9TELE|nr:hypothetical protein JZ751_019400 [Albula glossodonta]
MADLLAYTKENRQRILAVESHFGPSGKPLKKPGRVLVGEGRLMKQCRHSPRPRVFFLFNDILVYGSIMVKSRWYTNQQVIPLEDIVVEDLEDSPEMKNQWLIRTPRKSFYVSAASPEEKEAWIQHIKEYRIKRLEQTGRTSSGTLAASWIPDQATAICMRCCIKFTITQRRHHCRQCGFVVCGPCSSKRYVIPNISRKPVRVCLLCYRSLQTYETYTATRKRVNSEGKNWSDEDELAATPAYESFIYNDAGEYSENHSSQQWATPEEYLQRSCGRGDFEY